MFKERDDICKDLTADMLPALSYLYFMQVHRPYSVTPQAVDTGTPYRHNLDLSLRSTTSVGKLEPGNSLSIFMKHRA